MPFAPRSVLRRVRPSKPSRAGTRWWRWSWSSTHGGAQTPTLTCRSSPRPQRAQRDQPPGLFHRRGERVRPAVEDVYDYCEKMERTSTRFSIHEVGAGQMEHQLLPRPPAGPGRRGVPVQAHGARSGHAATTCSPPSWLSPSPASPAARCTSTRAWCDLDGAQHLQQRRRHAIARVLLVHRRLRKYIPAAMALFAPLRQQLPPAGALNGRADQHPVGHRQPHRGHPPPVATAGRRGASRTA